MKRLLKLIQTTLVGGVLFLVPLVVLVIMLEKALVLAHKLVDPLVHHLPFESVLGLRTPVLLAVALLMLFCLLAGLFARTALARRIVETLEEAVLSKVPGYALLKSTGASMLGVEAAGAYPVVLARFDDAWQLGFEVEALENGLVAVFIPGTPDPQAGSVFFMERSRVVPANRPLGAAMKCLKHYGAGSKALLRDFPGSGPGPK